MSFGTMIDATGEAVPALLAALGSNDPDTFATYVTGTGGVEASPGELSTLHGRAGLFKYDQSPALNSFGKGLADAADIEDFAGTFPNAVGQTKLREGRGWFSWWYFSASELDKARGLVHSNGFARTHFVVANWGLSQAEAQAFITGNPDVDAVQWASPSSNPNTICPGTKLTLAHLNVDLNVTRGGWFMKPVSVPPLPPKHRGIVVTENLSSMTVISNDGKTWTV